MKKIKPIKWKAKNGIYWLILPFWEFARLNKELWEIILGINN